MNDLKAKLDTIEKQLQNIHSRMLNLERLAAKQSKDNRTSGVVYKPVVVGVKDISAAQLYHAYKRGLNITQLCELADGKYTAEQIIRKLQKMEVQKNGCGIDV